MHCIDIKQTLNTNTMYSIVKAIKDTIVFVYDIDLDNCTLTHEDWAEVLAEALAYPNKFIEDLNNDYHEMIEERK